MLGRARSARDRLLRRVFGDERHMGLWILPLFVMAALLGAVLVGGLAALYYGQQVDDLEETTKAARHDLKKVADNVGRAAENARKDINRQVNQARDEFSRHSPIDSPAGSGIYSVSATHPDGEVRVGSAFAVYSNSSETYLISTYQLVATGEAGFIPSVDVFLPDQTISMRVHNVDRDRDLSVLVVSGGPLPVLKWRPVDEPVQIGDALYAVGIAGVNTPTVLEGRVAGVNDVAVVPDLSLNSFLTGAPLVDGSGRVVAIASENYAPFGVVEGTLFYAPPIRAVCEILIDCTAEDLGAGGLGTNGSEPPKKPAKPRAPRSEG
jgi:S1-C subfamily serine protease